MNISAEGLGTIDDLDIEGRRVLLRSDLNVPLVQGPASTQITDDTRIRAALPTIEELRRRGGRLVIVSHLDNPQGQDEVPSMRAVAERLALLTGVEVPLAPAVVGEGVRELTERLAPGEMMMLENVRFELGETRNEPRLAQALAELADRFVDDAFASAHRAHASTVGIAGLLPSAAGRLMEREIHALSAIVEAPARPLVAILGGTKVTDRIGVVQRLRELADTVCLGGAICLPFLAALGHDVGARLCPREDLEPARRALARRSGRLELPIDLRLARSPEGADGVARTLHGVDVPGGWAALDIGPATAAAYAAEISGASTLFWSGPVGHYEPAPFESGTRAVAQAIAMSSATSVVGGADTVKALRAFGLQDRVSHLSTGGEAAFQLLAGRELPGVKALLRTSLSAY